MSNLALQMDLFDFEPQLARALGPELTILFWGGGQDSTCLLYKYVLDPEFRQQYAPNRFLVVMAETGDEHPETAAHLSFTKKFCAEHAIEFVHVTPEMGYHGQNWQSLRGFYNAKGCCGSKSFPKSCTFQLKLSPLFKFIEVWIEQNYGMTAGSKKGYVNFARKYGKIRFIVGIAKGEERRQADPAKVTEFWKRYSIEMSYPLIPLGLDRAGCQAYMRSVNLPVPPPSNCILCPFMGEIELLWLWKFMRPDYDDWVRIEAVKIERNRHMDAVEVVDKKTGKVKIVNKNHGVWPGKTLTKVLKIAQEKYGHLSDDYLQDYKNSHGHCVMSSY